MGRISIVAARNAILRQLKLMRKWGESHTHYKNMLGSIPKDQRGSKQVKKAVNELLSEGKIIIKKTTQEHHVSLNPKLSQEINKEIKIQKLYINIQKENIYKDEQHHE